ncbi:PTS sugar transporter subunit IIB [Tepidimicrobium xylanilyticum]|uniref:PTS system, mannose-specific IIB component n=1 Tax=Tepidimicrobium xylanilyticum TaxID=1123352 RepID=A0A1H2WEY9_9FIRM|nr:PTS sugar transporter subunit IIB [Tepidimicrobium xylanilyticum]GMG95257.1 PTS sorbose transporter subunit IIC [Tepidimicrobium xylanilyticum]SDW79160.1 PTS system, mannose-specific IIB component [Tepidimicrobium xylanilyticum]
MIKLFRIDHRLLHGQVIFAWCKILQITRIIVVDDEAANDEFKKMTLSLTKPPEVKLNIFSVEEVLSKMGKIESLNDNIMMIFGGTQTMLKFCENYPNVKEINYGGIAKKEGSKQFSNAIFLNEEEIEDSRKLKNMGINLYMQQIPSSKREDLNSKL